MYDSMSVRERCIWILVGLLGLAGGVFYLATFTGDSQADAVLRGLSWFGVVGNAVMVFANLPAHARRWVAEWVVVLVLVYGPVLVTIHLLSRLD